MGTHHHALAALHAEVALPLGHRRGDGALLPAAGARGPGAIAGQGADRQIVAAARQQRADHLAHEGGGAGQAVGGGGRSLLPIHQRAPVQRLELIQAGLDGPQVHGHHRIALAAVVVVDGGGDRRQGLPPRQHAAEREEGHLHHGVDPASHAGLAGQPRRIDLPHPQLQVPDPPALVRRQPLPGFGRIPGAVEQQGAAALQAGQGIEPYQDIPVVHGHQGGALDAVGRPDRPGSDAQVRHRDRASLFGVVHEVTLHEQGCALADNANRGLAGAHRAVAAEAVQHRPHLAGGGLPQRLAQG